MGYYYEVDLKRNCLTPRMPKNNIEQAKLRIIEGNDNVHVVESVNGSTSSSAASGGVVHWCVESAWLVFIACGGQEGDRLSSTIGKGGKERERKERKRRIEGRNKKLSCGNK